MTTAKAHTARRRLLLFGIVLILLGGYASLATAHPLGNFTINHYARIEVFGERVALRCVVDMAEIPAFQEIQAIDTDSDGLVSEQELKDYGERAARKYGAGILLQVDNEPIELQVIGSRATTPPGAGNLPTLRVEVEFAGLVGRPGVGVHRLRFENSNYRDRLGWREVVVAASAGVSVFDTVAYGNGLTDELRVYPEDLLSAPLNERVCELSFARGAVPVGATVLLSRDGRPVAGSRDRLAELIAVPAVTPLVALLGLLVAAMLGAIHALSPGHGKTVVGAYLVGSRGTARHAAFLGMTVTITHTLGVFALGLVTLFASQYVVPERLFPILSLASGGIVVAIGLSLFVRRLRAVIGHSRHKRTHDLYDHSSGEHLRHDHIHTSGQADVDHSHTHSHLTHSDGGHPHSHLPPGADGSQITWRSLLALGISGGLLPCPSALVVLLSAISLNRVGYGLVLVVAFSMGLATTLTAVGLAFVYAGRLMKRPAVERSGLGRVVRLLPVVSALVITCAGAAICYEALSRAGVNLIALFGGLVRSFAGSVEQGGSLSTFSVLAIGLGFGLKHAVDADHLAAVSTMVSERKGLLSSSLVGGLWGLGHSISLLIVGIAVLLLHIKIGERTALALEFCVAIMLIALGANALRKLKRGGTVHIHPHWHGERAHFHLHIHDGSLEMSSRTHHGLRLSARPVLVGMVHGLAGSAALMLLVLSTISSPLIGLAYIVVFGVGSIGGMLVMSALVSLPIQFTTTRFTRANLAVRMFAAIFSLGFGLFMIYEIGFSEGLFG